MASPGQATRTDRIAAICRQATAHNYGQTVFAVDQSFLSDDVTVEMSSWPRAAEAIKALTAAGFQAEHSGDCSVVVR